MLFKQVGIAELQTHNARIRSGQLQRTAQRGRGLYIDQDVEPPGQAIGLFCLVDMCDGAPYFIG